MNRRTDLTTFSFDMGDGWMMDIVLRGSGLNNDDQWEAWIYREEYGTKGFMFGGFRQPGCEDLDEFIEIAEANFEGYKAFYSAEFCD